MTELEVPFNEAIAPDAVGAALRAHPDVTIVSVCHHDTPSGTLNLVDAIGAIVAAHGGYLLVDAVSFFGGMDVHSDACAADVFVTGGNKCIGCPPGLSLVGVSARAWAKMACNPDALRASALSLLDRKDAGLPGRGFPSTPLIAETNGLAVALGLDLWPAREEIGAPTATVIRVPAGVEEAQLRAAVRRLYGVVLSGGRGAIAGRVIRIGHMGPSAQPIYVTVAVAALGGALWALGYPADVGAGVAATLSIIDSAAAE